MIQENALALRALPLVVPDLVGRGARRIDEDDLGPAQLAEARDVERPISRRRGALHASPLPASRVRAEGQLALNFSVVAVDHDL